MKNRSRTGCYGLREVSTGRYYAEIIVVDDGSADKTAERAAEAGARVFRHTTNRGYGASLKSGISGASHDYVVMTDADGTYPCEYIPEMLSRLKTSDMVVGRASGANQDPLSRDPRSGCSIDSQTTSAT